MTSQVGAGCVCPTVPLLSLPTQAGKTELRTALVSSAGCFSLCLFYCLFVFFFPCSTRKTDFLKVHRGLSRGVCFRPVNHVLI